MKQYLKDSTFDKFGPVVIGGVGGSGTRVLADILLLLNFYLGNDLNEARDLLLYTLLFKRKSWFYKNKTNHPLLQTGLKLLQNLTVSKKPLSIKGISFLLHAILSMSIHGHNHLGHGKGFWPFIRVKKAFFDNEFDFSHFIGWGWKEPNSHLLITEMDQCFSKFKYIHTVRHGLDMAFSENQQQLYNWGSLFGIDLPKTAQEVPLASFRYWVKANRLALEKGALLGPDRFIWINFDQLCLHPEFEIRKLLSFLEIDADESVFRKCTELPIISPSSGRFRNFNLNEFDEKDLTFLKSLGFVI